MKGMFIQIFFQKSKLTISKNWPQISGLEYEHSMFTLLAAFNATFSPKVKQKIRLKGQLTFV